MDASSGRDLRSLLEQHHFIAWKWARRCVRGDADAALELLHDVYVMILEGRAKFGGRSSFSTWLFGVIRMRAKNAQRKRRVMQIFLQKMPAPTAAAAPPPVSATSAMLDAAVSRLPERQREIVALVFEADLTIEEAAKVMGVGIGAARTHYARAKQRLHFALQPSDDDYE